MQMQSRAAEGAQLGWQVAAQVPALQRDFETAAAGARDTAPAAHAGSTHPVGAGAPLLAQRG